MNGTCDVDPEERLLIPFSADLVTKARVFKALGDELRLKLLHLVWEGEVCVCKLMAILEMPQPTLSHHLSILHQAGLVTARKQGRWNFYRATPQAFALNVFSDPPTVHKDAETAISPVPEGVP